MRVLAVWAVLFAAYAATLGIDAMGPGDYAGDEPRYLLAAESIVSDGDIDLADEFATRAYADFHPRPLRPEGSVVLGRRLEPQGFGFALLIAPAYALGGAQGVELFLAAIAALGFALGALLARRIVPEPWAGAAAVLVGLSPPALAHASTVYPDLMAGTMLAGATLAALRVRERPDLLSAVVGATLLGLLPWLGPKYLLPAAPVAVALVRWTARRGRRTAALAAARDHGRVAGGLRDARRPALRRPVAVVGGGVGRLADRRGLGRRLPRAGAAARGAVGRPRRRARCAGRRCSRSACSRAGCCGGRAACTCHAWSASEPTPRSRPACPCSCARASSWSRRSARRRWPATGSRPGT